jgi:hypothetical protein
MPGHPHAADAARGKLELARIVRAHGAALRAGQGLSGAQLKALRAIERCRTEQLGGHIAQCNHCAAQQFHYHSCRNRHCPKCQTLAKERWLESRRAELLPVPYFHLVFTLPHEINALAQGNPRLIYGLLFAAASETLIEFGENPRWLGGSIAATLILHTWGQTLSHHPHVHALVAGGALCPDGRWIAPRRGFLFPVQALSKVFRGKFLGALSQWLEQGKLKLAGSTTALAQTHARRAWIAALRAKPWVVYAKQSLSGSEQVLDYLGRYTHKTAISNERLLAMDEQGNVRFSYRDRARGNQRKTMQLPARQFLARFLTHVLPRGFMRIRHYGLAANRGKHQLLAAARSALGVSAPSPVKPESVPAFWLRVAALDITLCPTCRIGHLCVVGSILPLAPYRARPP